MTLEAIFHGHSFVALHHDSDVVLIDPFVNGNTTCDMDVAGICALAPTAIVITHGHDDHIGDTLEIAKTTGCMIIATYEVAQWLVSQGCKHVHAQHIGGRVEYGERSVKYVPALHGGDIAGTTITGVAAGVLIDIGGHLVHHAGDTGLSQEMKLIGEYSPPDISFLPIGDRFTMGVDDAVIAASFIRAKYVVPVHYNTRPIIQADAIEFARRVMLDNYGVPKVLRPGQAVVLD